jgi:hypothetical protein
LLDRHGGGNYKVLPSVPTGYLLSCTFSTLAVFRTTQCHNHGITALPGKHRLSQPAFDLMRIPT